MIHLGPKLIDNRQGVIHTSGDIGGYWTFAVGGMKEVIYKIKCIHYWVASFDGIWKPTIPAGCPSDNGEQVMGLIKKRLTEVYKEG